MTPCTVVSEEPFLPALDMTFCGDLMAHSSNFRMSDYSLIYRDIEYITKNDDLTFTNLETPVVEDQAYENYPHFNVKPPYVEAALEAGFDVFSLTNNHSNDQGLKGINATLNYFSSLEETGAVTAACGLKPEGTTGYTWRLIDVNGWKVLFLAVTEILNTGISKSRIDFSEPDAAGHATLIRTCRTLREENPCDLFVLSMHVAETEYVRTVRESRRQFFYELLDAGIDIIWANHPHVTQEWELIADPEDGSIRKIIMYSMGNLISGQRYYYNYDHPEADREYTGDSLIMKVSAVRDDDGAVVFDYVQPLFITTEIDKEGNFIIKRYTESFIADHSEKQRAYFKKRHELITQTTGTTTCR